MCSLTPCQCVSLLTPCVLFQGKKRASRVNKQKKVSVATIVQESKGNDANQEHHHTCNMVIELSSWVGDEGRWGFGLVCCRCSKFLKDIIQADGYANICSKCRSWDCTAVRCVGCMPKRARRK